MNNQPLALNCSRVSSKDIVSSRSALGKETLEETFNTYAKVTDFGCAHICYKHLGCDFGTCSELMAQILFGLNT